VQVKALGSILRSLIKLYAQNKPLLLQPRPIGYNPHATERRGEQRRFAG